MIGWLKWKIAQIKNRLCVPKRNQLFSPRDAAKKVQWLFPNRVVISVKEYDEDFYAVFTKLRIPIRRDFDALYRVNKKTGRVSVLILGTDYEKFRKMLHRKPLYIR